MGKKKNFLFFVFWRFFGFLGLKRNLELYSVIELSSFLLVYLYFKSTTKESFSAFSYLFCFSGFLGVFFFGDFLWNFLKLNLFYHFLSLGIGILMFFGKLPCFFFHYWLPKGHVEVLTPRSVVLAALILKFGAPFLGGFFDEILLSMFFGFFICYIISCTKDFKVFVAYSSILHMTVFCLRLRIFCTFLCEYFLIPHTLLSRCLFWYFSCIYGFFGVRILSFFGSFLCGGFLLFWLGLPVMVNFLVEFFIFSYSMFDMMLLVFWFFVFWFFMWISVNFLSRQIFKVQKNFLVFWRLALNFFLFWVFWLF